MTTTPARLRFALFDLDQTLYPMSSGIMDEVGKRINQYMRERCGFAESEILAFRDGYFRKYGTTLRGLILHHGVDPADYLEYVHNVPLEEFVAPNPALDEALAGLSLIKVIFTNSSEAHARRVLGLLGVARHFSAIIDVKAIGYLNKPDPGAYVKALQILGARAQECVLLDDSERNLLPGREMGMVTIAVGSQRSEIAHFAISTIEHFPQVIARLDGNPADSAPRATDDL